MQRGIAGSIQRVMHFFLPKEEEFFSLFVQMGERAHAASLLLQRMFHDYPDGDTDETVSQIDAIEEEVDALRHDCVQRLHEHLRDADHVRPPGHLRPLGYP